MERGEGDRRGTVAGTPLSESFSKGFRKSPTETAACRACASRVFVPLAHRRWFRFSLMSFAKTCSVAAFRYSVSGRSERARGCAAPHQRCRRLWRTIRLAASLSCSAKRLLPRRSQAARTWLTPRRAGRGAPPAFGHVADKPPILWDCVQSSIMARKSTLRALALLRRRASQIIVQVKAPNVTMTHCTGTFARSSSA